jgi:hypothetical protein
MLLKHNVFKEYGKYASTNNLVKYEDTINDLIKSKKKRDLPDNIYYYKRDNRYYSKIKYNNIEYKSSYKTHIKEAEKDLSEIISKINKIKNDEEQKYLQQPILRNKDDIPIILVKLKRKIIEVLVDEDLWYDLNRVTWGISDKGYIQNKKLGKMHIYIMQPKEGDIVDHKHGIKHDNRRCMLRISNHIANNHNRIKKKNTSSKYFGVSYEKKFKKWASSISKNDKRHFLGRFENEIDAAIAYNIKAIELYGDLANLNIFD